ncbi:DinB family protein [Jeotgalibacillus proteolyticus]|uniref:Damage-inducible protein DinB n=1 Tax=Jeotgalibacillus proteolyticus TaxID=2082395 RepID=A0A2S5GDE0_9BACL|nr:DinB family protein [Jeotgalibacillus proteolyticus]PPA70931.1 damage-inducible protein DinB [Jeotgalibacillus proteolyticus]
MAKIDEYLKSWLSHREALIELIDVIEDENLHYKPWDGAMSFAELVTHIGGSTGMFVQTVKNGEFTPPDQNTMINSVTELKDYLQASTEETISALKEITPEQLEQKVDFYGSTLTGELLLENGKEHEIHHKGQLFTYARLTGAENVPFFIVR